MKLPNDHQTIEAESFLAEKGALKGQVALRPAKGQKFPTTLLLEGSRASSDRLTATGFRFSHPDLSEALKDLLRS